MRISFLLFLSFLYGGTVFSQTTNSAYLCLGNSDLVLANFDNCSSSFITSTPESLFDICQGDTDDTLYGLKDERLYRINIANGNVVLLGDLTVLGSSRNFRVTSLVKESSGFLLGVNQSSSGELFRIDVNAMTATNLGSTGFNSSGDLTYLNGDLYLSAENNELVLINVNNPSASSFVGSMAGSGIGNIFGVVTVITADPCAADPTYGLIATGGRSMAVVDPSTGAPTISCSNFVSDSIFGAAEVNSDVICSIDLDILGDGIESPSYCDQGNPALVAALDPITPIGVYLYEWREVGNAAVLATTPSFNPVVNTTTVFECQVIDTGRAAPDNIASDRITVTINENPTYNPLGTVITHSFYELPAITGSGIPADAAYYTQPNGLGTRYDIGDSVAETDFAANPTTLYVYGTDSNSCELTGQFNLQFVNVQVDISPVPQSGIIEVCEGESITLTATPDPSNPYGNYTYNWDDGLGSTLPDTATITVVPTTDTTFSVSVNDSGIVNGIGVGFDMIPVQVYPFLDIDDLPDQLASGSFTFPAITGTGLSTPAPRYSLTPGAQGSFYDPGDTVEVSDFPSLPVRIYVFDTNGICTDQEDFLLDFVEDLTVSITPSRAETCAGENVTYEAITNPSTSLGTYSYEWRVLGSTAVIGTLRELDYAANSTLELECTVVDSGITGASGTAVATVEVEVTPRPRVDDLPDITVVNSFTFPTITGNNLTGNERFYLESGGVGTSFQTGDMVNRTNFISLPVTIYVYDAVSGCSSQTDFELDILPVNLTMELSASSLEVCEGTSVDFTATVNPNDPTDRYIFTWILDGTTIADTGPRITITPLSPRSTIRCVVQDPGIAGAPDSVFEEIVINVTPAIMIDDPGDQVVTGSYTFPSPSGSNLTSNVIYNTDSGGAGRTFSVGDVVTAADFTGMLPVEIFIIDSNGVCDAIQSFFLDFDDTPPSVIINSSATDICMGDQVRLSIIVTPSMPIGTYTYEWSEAGVGTVLGTDEVLDIMPDGTTQYQCVVLDTGLSTGSNQTQASITISVDQLPVLDMLPDVIVQDQFVFPEITGTDLSGSQDFFSQSMGNGTIYSSGDILNFDASQAYPITFYAYDRTPNGCFDEISFELTILEPAPELFYIPELLTPNQDNYHDTWNVEILNQEVTINQVYVFDRYGKLLKEIVPGNLGWDGTLNELPLPSSSYWYKFEYVYKGVTSEERGYFALKR